MEKTGQNALPPRRSYVLWEKINLKVGGSGSNCISVNTSNNIDCYNQITKYDSIDADVLQSYMEYSLASLIYYAMKVIGHTKRNNKDRLEV